MVLLECQHGAEADGASTAATNVDTMLLGLNEKLVTLGAVEGDEGTLALATEVLEVLGVLGSETLNLAVEVVTDAGGVVDEVEALDLLDDGAEDEAASRVTDPGVELTVRLVGAQSIGVVVTGSLGLLGEGDHVRSVLEVPVFVGPELAGGADAGLNLVDDEESVVLAGDGAELLEELGAGVVVTTFGLDRLNHDGGNRQVPRLQELLNLVDGGLLSSGVLSSVLVKRVLELREGGLGPVEGGEIELVDGLGAGGRERAKQATVEGALERENGELRRARRLVVHGRLDLLGGEVDVGATTVLLAAPHEGGLVGKLVGVGAREGSEDVVDALGGNLEQAGADNLGPVAGGEVSGGGTVDEGVDHLGSGGGLGQGVVVVAYRDGGNLSIAGKNISMGPRASWFVGDTHTSRRVLPSTSTI